MSIKAFRICLWPILAIPVIFSCYQLANNALGADPIKTLMLRLGDIGVYLLMSTMVLGWLKRHFALRYFYWARRPFGVATFVYVSLHLIMFVHAYLGWEWNALFDELNDRYYILFGMMAWLLLLPLALTSSDGWVRRLGRRWRHLHQLVYGVIFFVVIHVVLQVRADYFEALVLSVLFGVIIVRRIRALKLIKIKK